MSKSIDSAARNTLRVKSLADYIGSQMPHEEFYRWLREIMAGRDPDAPPGTFQTPIDTRYRMMAMKMLMDRRYGSVTQIINAEIRGQVQFGQGEAYRALPEEKRRELRETMRALLAPPIDVE